MKYKPEHESNLNKFKNDIGITWGDLCLHLNYPKSYRNVLCGLSTGAISPLNERSELKPVVKKLLIFFNTTFEELFPRYSCKLDVDYMSNHEFQCCMMSEFTNYVSNSPEVIFCIDELIVIITKLLSKLKDNRLNDYFINGISSAKIAEVNNVSRQAIQQRIVKFYNILKLDFDIDLKNYI